MTYPIYAASEQVLTKSDKQIRATKYPWHTLKLGQAFIVDDSEISYPSMLTLARRTGMRHDRVYKVYHHVAHKKIEVAYVSDVVKPNQQQTAAVPQIGVAAPNDVLAEVRKMEE